MTQKLIMPAIPDFANSVFREMEVASPKLHYLDSGSFSLWSKAKSYAKTHSCSPWLYYDTKDFWRYIDNYAEFVKKYRVAIDYYSNVDAIPNPELTWRNQQYLESLSLNPVPVFHYPCDLKWLKHYMDEGYDYIALGGMVGSVRQEACKHWLDNVFRFVCDQPSRLPKVKLHGFGITNFNHLTRYPWYSVDSTAWTKLGAFGGILIPHKRKGVYEFLREPYSVKVSCDSPTRTRRGSHVFTMANLEVDKVQEWLDFINIPMGDMDEDGNPTDLGVVNLHWCRRAANLVYFALLVQCLPEWPWPFRTLRSKGFGL